MASISAVELANEVLAACLEDGTWPSRALDALIERALDESEPFEARAATKAFFSIVVERLADLFEPELCDVYARLFSYVIGRALPGYDPRDLLVRYRNIRQPREFAGGEVARVYVLSRVTLGADVAVTSVVMDAARKRFPEAEIAFVGPEKNAALFANAGRILPISVAYGRSSLLVERLSAAVELNTLIDEPGTIVIDPDSRLTQLGLIPVCDDSRYYFFESRGFGGTLPTPLPELTAQWAADVFDVSNAKAWLDPVPQPRLADITVSLGVGENESKRMGSDFERELLAFLLDTGRTVLVDCGAGGEEAERVRALARFFDSDRLKLHDGSYAGFASHILQSELYVGYDSAGQHVASAGDVPMVSIFAGYVCERMFERWRPSGPRTHVIRVDALDPQPVLAQAKAAILQAVAEAE